MIRKEKAISLKLAQFVVLVTMPLTGSAMSAPITPPTSAISADSARKLASTLLGWKPSVSSTAISGLLRGHGGVHRVDRSEHGAERHDAGDHDREGLEDRAQELRLLGVEIRLAVHVHRDPLVGLQGALGLLEGARVLEPERQGLERLPPEHRQHLLVLAPDLRLERRAAGREAADHGPVAAAEAQGLADRRCDRSDRPSSPRRRPRTCRTQAAARRRSRGWRAPTRPRGSRRAPPRWRARSCRSPSAAVE